MEGTQFEEALKAMKDWSYSVIFTDNLQIIAKAGVHNYALTNEQMK